MKKQATFPSLSLGVLLFCAAGAFLRFRLYRVGIDEKNLLVRGHPLEAALWVCTALAAALVCILTLREKKIPALRPLPFALSHLGAAAAIALTVLSGSLTGSLAAFWKYTGLAAAALLVFAGLGAVRGKRPFFGGYAGASVFFALHLVCHYQSWCADPQLQNYFFSFAGILALMLFAYHHAAAAVGRSTLGLRISGLLAAFFCFVSLSGTQYPLLYALCGLWAFTCPGLPQKDGDADAAF